MGAKEVKIINPIKDKEDVIRVAAYCRVSADREDQVNSFLAQVRYYNDYIRSNGGMRLVDIYADEGITGTEADKRDDFKRLVADVKKRKIDRVLVKSVTRFARNSLECLETVRLFKSNGASVYFESDNIDTERMNSEMILYIKSAFAQGEVQSASKRMATSVRMRMADGKYKYAAAPFGYRLENGELKVNEAEAEVVREIYSLALSGLGEVRILNKMKKRYPDMEWKRGRIIYILTSEVYTGDCLFQKSYTPNVIPFRQKVNRGELPKYRYENDHEAIVSKADFNAVRLLRQDKRHGRKSAESKAAFFTGKVFCRKCGWGYRNIKKGMMCGKKQSALHDGCKAPTVYDERLTSAFVRTYNALQQNSKRIVHEAVLQLQTIRSKINGGNDEVTEIDGELLTLGEQLNIFAELYTNKMYDEVSYFEQTGRIKNRITELRARRLKLLNDDDEMLCIEKLKALENILSERGCITEFDGELMDSIVERIYVEQSGELVFALKCGLELPAKKGL